MNKELKTWINDLIHSNAFNNSSLIDQSKTFKFVSETINKKTIAFAEATKAFEQLIPVIWEKSLQYAR